jgi:hypothetical protein
MCGNTKDSKIHCTMKNMWSNEGVKDPLHYEGCVEERHEERHDKEHITVKNEWSSDATWQYPQILSRMCEAMTWQGSQYASLHALS